MPTPLSAVDFLYPWLLGDNKTDLAVVYPRAKGVMPEQSALKVI